MGTKRPWWLLHDGHIIGNYSTEEKAKEAMQLAHYEWPHWSLSSLSIMNRGY